MIKKNNDEDYINFYYFFLLVVTIYDLMNVMENINAHGY